MTRLQKLKFHPILRWVSFNLCQTSLKSPDYPIFGNIVACCSVETHYRFYTREVLKVEETDYNEKTSTSNGEIASKISPTIKREAQSALIDYLHCTRSLQFVDAEYMSKNSPHFLRKLIENVHDEPDIGRSMTRFLRYHPINEFQPFFESIGLEPSDFVPLLPRNLMFLRDEDGLLDNYHVLCEYGIARKNIGKIFRVAREVFQYGDGVLQSKLQVFEELGVSHAAIAKAVCSSPYLLIGNMGKAFVLVVRRLKCLGLEYKWVEGYLLENTSSNWRQIFDLLGILSDLGCKDESMRDLIHQHPELLFDGSGGRAFSVIVFMVKLGSMKNDMFAIFSLFPQIEVGKFVWNLRRVYELLIEIEMNSVSIGMIMRPNFTWLGLCSLKKANSILAGLNTGKKRLCDIIRANPLELKKWVLRAKIERLLENGDEISRMEKIKFVSSMGFVENSKEMEKALKAFRGKGEELQEIFDCLVKAGLNQEDVTEMIEKAPQILNQSKEVIEAKIRLLVDDLGYPLSSVKPFPAYISYTIERVKLGHSMYMWLIDKGAVQPPLSLSTIISFTESYFMRSLCTLSSASLYIQLVHHIASCWLSNLGSNGNSGKATYNRLPYSVWVEASLETLGG